jgi:hypothetical protein
VTAFHESPRHGELRRGIAAERNQRLQNAHGVSLRVPSVEERDPG